MCIRDSCNQVIPKRVHWIQARTRYAFCCTPFSKTLDQIIALVPHIFCLYRITLFKSVYFAKVQSVAVMTSDDVGLSRVSFIKIPNTNAILIIRERTNYLFLRYLPAFQGRTITTVSWLDFAHDLGIGVWWRRKEASQLTNLTVITDVKRTHASSHQHNKQTRQLVTVRCNKRRRTPRNVPQSTNLYW